MEDIFVRNIEQGIIELNRYRITDDDIDLIIRIKCNEKINSYEQMKINN